MQHSINDDMAFINGEVDAMISRTTAMQFAAARTVDGTKSLGQNSVVHIRWLNVKRFQ